MTQPTVSDRRVVIVGAGPYGLAAAAHLRAARVDTHVFGRSMEFWRRQMPTGMFLRSAWEASSIADPGRRLSLDAYREACAPTLSAPIPIADFLRYADWFRQDAVPDVDERDVVRIDRTKNGFRLMLDDGDELAARRVVVAAGLASFASRPTEFDAIPATLASHSSEHTDFSRFAGQRVLVTGGGQSALESAALLREAGAEVEVLVRARLIHWLPAPRLTGQLAPVRRRLYKPFIHRVLYAPTDVGPPGLNWLVAVPRLFRALPGVLQEPIAHRCIRPAGAAWLPARLERVALLVGRAVVSAQPQDDRLEVTLDDGTVRVVDHALLATGFRVDVRGYPFLSAGVVDALRLDDGFPLLKQGFESSVPGLHFVGAASAKSFGPIMRFVCGTRFTGRELARVLPSSTLADRCRGGRGQRTVDADALRSA
jgi:FAD-dependent urate hydroxylase